MSRSLVVVGDALLDRDVEGVATRLSPDAPVPVLDEREDFSHPGGAALAACMAAGDGFETYLVTALADDQPGRTLARLLEASGVQVVDLGLHGPTPERIRLRAGGQSLLRLDRGGPAPAVGEAPAPVRRLLAGAAAVLVSNYGRGVVHAVTLNSQETAHRPWVWDPHPHGPPPLPGMTLVTPNRSELFGRAPAIAAATREEVIDPQLVALAIEARRDWKAQGVAVTLGARGTLLVQGEGPPLLVPVRPVLGADPRGAGDRFAVAAAGGLAEGGVLSEVVVAATAAATEWVARGPGPCPAELTSAPRPRLDPEELAAQVRAQGGTVVATGGCFDLLHAGHVQLLRAARLLGDCVIVCVNSDASVFRVKGPGRPLVPHHDRVAMLEALSCVDAVATFEEDTPAQLLRRLRPHIFAKGGDYAGRFLSEADVLAAWGGQVVTLPYLDGRSSSALIKLASQPAR
jgi:D-beta-D-heptose 7-phosphate kinase / D-beta-D-heptose 1-phosphate adenosyltransferase